MRLRPSLDARSPESSRESSTPRSPAIGPDGARRARRSSSAALSLSLTGALIAIGLSAMSGCGPDTDTVFGDTTGFGDGGASPAGSTGTGGNGGTGGPGGTV